MPSLTPERTTKGTSVWSAVVLLWTADVMEFSRSRWRKSAEN
jgi:hypothetical protein